MKRTFRLSFGSKPPIADEQLRKMLDEAPSDAAESPDGTGAASFSVAIDRSTGEPLAPDDPRFQEMLERATAIANAAGEAEVAVEIDGIKHTKAFKAGEPGMHELLDRAREFAKTSADVRISVTSRGANKALMQNTQVQELIERASADAAQSPDGTGVATNTRSFKIEFAAGKLRVGEGGLVPYEDPPPAPSEDPKEAREREMWDRLHLIAEGKGAYPDTQRWHRWLSMGTWVIAIALPLAALILAIATGQDAQTVVVMTFGAAIVAAMFRGSIR
jgi:hypothetical protein